MMTKISQAEQGQMMKMAAANVRALAERSNTLETENTTLKEKVAFYVKRERVEKIAKSMSDKGIEPELPMGEKVAALMKRDNLDVIEEAVNMSAPQMKLAHADGGERVLVEGGSDSQAEADFFRNILTMESNG